MVTTRGQSRGESTRDIAPAHKKGRKSKNEPKKKATPDKPETVTEGKEKPTISKRRDQGEGSEEATAEKPSKKRRVEGKDVQHVYKIGGCSLLSRNNVSYNG